MRHTAPIMRPMTIDLPGGLTITRHGRRGWGAQHGGAGVGNYANPVTAVLALWSWKRTMRRPGAV